MKKPLHVTIPITKIDEEQRMVYGYATVEEVDSHGEMITYEASKKAFSNWIGNIREMHENVAVGKALEIEFDDENKGVWLGARISESDDGEQAWIKVKEGVYSGFSIGGKIMDMENRTMSVDGKKTLVPVITEYTLGETSLVDNPACPSATFQMVKSAKSGLVHHESIVKRDGHPVHWWEKRYKFSDSQDIMKSSFMSYNEDSMNKQSESFAKSLWEASMLVDLAMCLSDYIYWKRYEGEDVADLETALTSIKEAASMEALEPENFPQIEVEIENATKALNISKMEDLKNMSEHLKKTVVGSEDRDDEANVVTTQEQNGRPVNDTEERAESAGVATAGATVENEVAVVDEDGNETGETKTETSVQPLVNETAENTEDESSEEVSATDEEESPKAKGKKSATEGADLNKSTDSDIAKTILSGVEELVQKAVMPLKEEIDALKKGVAPSKVRTTHTVVKGEDVENHEDDTSAEAKLRKEFDETLKRSEELAKDANVGTPEERMQVAFKLRKMSRQLDPKSIAQHAAIKSTFN